jgi:hypothetical protein
LVAGLRMRRLALMLFRVRDQRGTAAAAFIL